MRAIVLLLFTLTAIPAYTQLNEDITWPSEIQSVYDRASILVKNSKFEESKLCYDTLLIALNERKTVNPIEGELQNYYHVVILDAVADMRTYQRDSARVKLLALESELINVFPNGNILFGMIYHVLGILISPKPEAHAYFEKALQLRKKYFGETHSSVASTLTNFSTFLRKQDKYTEAEKHTLDAIRIAENAIPQDTSRLIAVYHQAHYLYAKLSDKDKSLFYILEAESLCKKAMPRTHRYHTVIYSALSQIYGRKNEFEKAMKYDYKSLQIKKEKYGEDHHPTSMINYYNLSLNNYKISKIKKANVYIDTAIMIQKKVDGKYHILGSLYVEKSNLTSDLKQSKEDLEKGLMYIQKSGLPQHYNKGVIYNNLSTIYKKRGNITEALNYLYKAREIYIKGLPKTKSRLSTNYYNVAGIFENLGKYEKAIEYAEKGLEISNELPGNRISDNIYNYRALANNYAHIGNYPKAYSYLEKCLQYGKNEVGKETYDLATTYKTFGYYYYAQNKYNEAIKNYKKAVNIYLNIGSDINYRLPHIYNQLAKCYTQLDETTQAKEWVNACLNEVCVIKKNGIYNFDNVPEFYMWKASKAYFDGIKILYNMDQNRQTLITDISVGIEALDKVKASYFYDNAIYEFQKNTRLYYDWSIQEIDKLYKKEQSEEVLHFLFYLIEKSKANNISRGFERVQSHSQNDVPQHIIAREKTILYEYEKAFQTTQNTKLTNENPLVSDSLNSDLVFWQDAKTEFIDSIKVFYPEYYKSRYSFDVISYTDLKEICATKNLSVFNYYWSDTTLVYIITTAQKDYTNSISHKDIVDRINNLVDMMHNRESWNQESNYAARKKNFVLNANALYKMLFEGLPIDSLPEHWIIAGDGELLNISFDILLTKPDDSTKSYKDLSYLLNQKVINNICSATQMINETNKSTGQNPYVGYSPSYTENKISSDIAMRSATSFSQLYENENEVKSAASLFAGQYHTKDEANEQNFKRSSVDSRILHLAMHAYIDNGMPINSFLQFSQDTTLTEDAKLHAYEIAQLSLGNDLVVLSACETNKGSESGGEGILGIAKAFQLAGSPNMVISHWLVDDASARDIIYSFFKNANKKESFAKSLTMAKRQYLNESTEAKSFPAFWATFSYFGDPNMTLEDSGSYNITYMALACLSILLLLVWIGKKRGVVSL